jgi:hypothetical protein
MKIKKLAFMALISMIICGTGLLRYFDIHSRSMILGHSHQNQISEPNRDRSVLISKSMTLLLLTIGVIGILAVRRKKENPKEPVQHNSAQIRSEDRNKSFIKLNKQYLKLQYKITQHKISGDSPPDGLVKEFSDLERKIRLISRALEQRKDDQPQRSLRSSGG